MGANSQCCLPNDIRARDLVTAIAYLCGAKRLEGGAMGVSWASVDHKEVSSVPGRKASRVYVLATHDMQYHNIEIAPTTCDNHWHSLSLFTYPDADRPGYICLYAGVNDFWKAVMRALVDMFGGYVDDEDCDSSEVDYKKRKPRKFNAPNDGEAYSEFQQDLLDLPQLFEFVD